MNPNASKNQKLIKQYPFVSDILNQSMEPYASWRDNAIDAKHVDDLTIRVEKADANLMFRTANNIGLGDHSFSFSTTSDRKDQVMRRGEHVFAVDKKGQIINRLNFPRNDEEQRKSLSETYAQFVLWRSRGLNASGTGYLYKDSLDKETKYIVWATVEAWHTSTKNNDAPESQFGEFRDRSVYITIYGEPDEGFLKLQENANVYENLCLNDRLIMRGVLDKNHDIVSMGGMLYEMCIMFQDDVYFNGMKDILDKGKYRGASGQFGSVKVLCAELCGYDRVMLEDATGYVTFQLRPGSRHMYVLGEQGTIPQIRNLVRTVVRMWNQKPELRASFKPDKKVSVI